MRCEICGKSTSALTELIEERYTCRSSGLVMICSECFRLLIVDNYDELDKKFKKKLGGKDAK